MSLLSHPHIIPVPDALETDRLRLRPMCEGDLDPFVSFMLDEGSTRYLMFTDRQKTREGATELLRSTVASYGTEGQTFALAVAERDTDAFTGSCGLAPMPDGTLMIYWAMLEQHRGRGYATEATRALLEYAADLPGAPLVVAWTHPDNTPSGRVAAKAGFRFRGVRPHPFTGQDSRFHSWPPTAPGLFIGEAISDSTLDEALNVRRLVFVGEQGVPEAGEFDALDDSALHLLGREGEDGPAVATGRIVIKGQEAKLERVAVLREHRGKGHGREMTMDMVARALARGSGSIFIHAQTRAAGFYRKMGFVARGETFDEAGIEHVKMVLDDGASRPGPRNWERLADAGRP